MRIDGLSGRDRMFPLFLHFRVHYQKGIVWEVDGYLAFGIGVGVIVFPSFGARLVVFADDFADAEFS